ncbi:hypothetical protein Vretifemale_2756 [Volvox reticuliferus]|uniref:Uncharacterized protein n=1 Tax=Volvox reticuliferus TaxID=1737510 RepID=A0A8J4C0Z2_9CHLO|nr:hypothetical protein Vretifemale_2756 [Volvox reticuliferus]
MPSPATAGKGPAGAASILAGRRGGADSTAVVGNSEMAAAAPPSYGVPLAPALKVLLLVFPRDISSHFGRKILLLLRRALASEVAPVPSSIVVVATPLSCRCCLISRQRSSSPTVCG